MSFGPGSSGGYPPSSLNPGTGGNRDPIKPYRDEISYQAQHTADLEREDAEGRKASPLEARPPIAGDLSQLVLRRSVVEIGGRPLAEVRYRKAAAGTLSLMENRQPVVASIRTERVELASMSLAFMQALVAGDHDTATREMGADLPAGLAEDLRNFLNYRIPDLEADPSIQPWLGRGIIWSHPDGRRELIGSLGFHNAPDETGRVEIGYRVEAAFRRRGIATECVRALLAWAETQGVHRFRASVSPGNVASLAIIRAFGFHQVGVQMDEIDGEELVFHLDRPSGEVNAAGD